MYNLIGLKILIKVDTATWAFCTHFIHVYKQDNIIF